jgi:acetylglutamate kinase
VSELAIALSEIYDVTLKLFFETGVLFNSEDDSSVIELMNTDLYLKLKSEKRFIRV